MIKVEEDIAELPQSPTLKRFNPERVPQIDLTQVYPVCGVCAAVAPDCSYRLLSDTLKSAKSELLLYIYNLSAETLLSLLRDCKNRDIQMRVMFDATGNRVEERQKLEALGVEIKEAPSTKGRNVFSVCHQNFAVVDQEKLLIGCANWTESAFPKIETPGKFLKGNREWLLRVDDSSLAGLFKGLFDTDWEIPEVGSQEDLIEEPLDLTGPLMVPGLPDNAPEQIFDQEKFDLTLPAQVRPIISPDNYFDLAKSLILNAAESIYLQQQYILAGGPKTKSLLEALESRKSEVEIRIIASPVFGKKLKKDNWELTCDSLEAFGLKENLRAHNLKYYTNCHNKGIIVDRKSVIISSTSWSEYSIAHSREAGVLVHSAEITEYFAKVFDFDWEISWDPAAVTENLMNLISDALFTPDGFEVIHPADLA